MHNVVVSTRISIHNRSGSGCDVTRCGIEMHHSTKEEHMNIEQTKDKKLMLHNSLFPVHCKDMRNIECTLMCG